MSTSPVPSGKNVTLDVDPSMSPFWAIRGNAGLYSTKFGCGMTQCGACTVQLGGTAMRSCVSPVSAAAGRRVTTIESIRGKPGKAVRGAWVKLQVPQCGYYQSGQVMSATVLLEQSVNPSDADINTVVSGNICRCAAYVRVRVAIHETADTLKA